MEFFAVLYQVDKCIIVFPIYKIDMPCVVCGYNAAHLIINYQTKIFVYGYVMGS